MSILWENWLHLYILPYFGGDELPFGGNMKKFFLILILVSLLLWGMVTPVHAATPINASAAIMIDATTGQVIYEQNAQKKLPVASISKLLTAIVIEDEVQQKQITGDSKVKISDEVAAISNDSSYSAIGLQAGESYTVRELLNAALVKSADGATLALASAAGDGIEEFNMKMQQKAQAIGLQNITIVNPVGLTNGDLKSLALSSRSDNAENKMSASDVALLSRYLVNHYPQLLQVTAQKQATFYIAKNKSKVEVNLNRMLPGGKYTVPGVKIDGLNMGTSDAAGACFVSTGTYRGHRIITVVLHANGQGGKNACFIQTQRLYQMLKNYQFQAIALPKDVRQQKMADGVNRSVTVSPTKVTVWKTNTINHYTLAVKLRKKLLKHNGVLQAPLKKGERLGQVELSSSQVKTISGEPLCYPIYSSTNEARGEFWQRLWH